MTSDEVWDLLEIIASVDRRKLGLTDRQVWQRFIGDLAFPDAQAAVEAYYREHREWIMPSDVRKGVKAIRADRAAGVETPAPPAELLDDPPAYIGHLRETARQIADGRPGPRALDAS